MLKTNKSVAKRVKVTKKSVKRRPLKQNHYLAKLTGTQKQKKRKSVVFSKPDTKKIKSLLPYNNK